MKTQKLLAVFLSCLILCQISQAQTATQNPTSNTAEDACVARLAGLGKVWGAMKFFHPYLAYREIDWDKALVNRAVVIQAGERAPESGGGALEIDLPENVNVRIRTSELVNPVSRPMLEAPSMSNTDYATGAHYSFAQQLPERKGDVYRGKVVMLIDEGAINQVEHTCLFFASATGVTFIGKPTAGANGDITYMVLAANLTVSFSGHDVRHADGRELQRVGIQPTIKVAPTIRGTVEGRDEILERAITYLAEKLNKS